MTGQVAPPQQKALPTGPVAASQHGCPVAMHSRVVVVEVVTVEVVEVEVVLVLVVVVEVVVVDDVVVVEVLVVVAAQTPSTQPLGDAQIPAYSWDYH